MRKLVAGVLIAAGCGDAKKPESTPPAIGRASAPAPANHTLLWRDVPTAASFARRTLYTWTTSEQVEELRRTKVLLSREESPEHGASYFEQYIHMLASTHGPAEAIAKLLDSTGYAKSRFAWIAPWATREGIGDEVYGEQLIRIDLAADAIVLALAGTAFTAHDLSDAPIDLAIALAHPERIAAVYFDSGSFREYIVCNESMIASYTVGTDEIRDVALAEAAALEALADKIATTIPPDLAADYQRALALPNPSYNLTTQNLQRIAMHLRGLPRPHAIEGGGRTAWAGIGQPRTPPRTIKRGGTYLGTY